jgi:ATP-dependent Lon protease
MIPEILKSINLKKDINIIIDKEVIEYIINKKTTQESGVRQLRKNIEKLVYRLNYDILTENEMLKKVCDNTFNISRLYVDKVLKQESQDNDYMGMYI